VNNTIYYYMEGMNADELQGTHEVGGGGEIAA
jgi:hypothetical protein